MEGPEDLADAVRRLEARVQSLEALYGLVDLLALPGLLAGGAARIFDSTQAADTIPAQAAGFYGKEVDGRGVPIRWTRFPEPGVLDIAVLEGIPFLLRLRVLNQPHIQRSEDLDVRMADGRSLQFSDPESPEHGILAFETSINPERTGVLRLLLSSTSRLQAGAGDTRTLGLPFVELRSSPRLQITPAG